MKKTYKMEIDCANCAAAVEREIKKIPGVNSASVNFFAQKLIVDADDAKFEEIMDEIVRISRKIEPDSVISR